MLRENTTDGMQVVIMKWAAGYTSDGSVYIYTYAGNPATTPYRYFDYNNDYHYNSTITGKPYLRLGYNLLGADNLEITGPAGNGSFLYGQIYTPTNPYYTQPFNSNPGFSFSLFNEQSTTTPYRAYYRIEGPIDFVSGENIPGQTGIVYEMKNPTNTSQNYLTYTKAQATGPNSIINVPVPFAQGNMVAIADQRSLDFRNVMTGRYRTIFRVESGTGADVRVNEVQNNFYVSAANDLAVASILEPPMHGDYPISSNMNIRVRAVISNFSAVTPVDSFYARARVYSMTNYNPETGIGTRGSIIDSFPKGPDPFKYGHKSNPDHINHLPLAPGGGSVTLDERDFGTITTLTFG